jgi:hypothetical protein
MKRLSKRLVIAVSVVLAAAATPAQATTKQYVLKHPKHEHCRAHYIKRTETVKKREHDRTVKVRETLCIYVAPTASAPNTPGNGTPATPTTPLAPITPQPTPVVTLASHLDPTFTQDPANPLVATYTYDASATQTVDGVSTPETNLPAGVLDLYSDGLLACSINVGGSTTGGQCNVTYQATGSHTVVVTYESGSASATATYAEQINPFATTAIESVSSDSCTTVKETAAEIETKCAYTVGASVFDSNGNPPPGEGEIRLEVSGKWGGGEVTAQPVLGIETGAASCSIMLESMRYPKHEISYWGEARIVGSSGCAVRAGHELGDYYYEINGLSVSAAYPGRLGWAASQSAAQQLTS